MARRKDSFYFSHDSNARHDPNICEMRAKWGLEGYAMYWIIVEMLREQTDYKLRLDRINAIAMQTQCEKNKTEEFINDCIFEFELFDSDENFFWSNSLLNRMKAFDEKSEKAKISAYARWNKQDDANALQTQCDSNANQIKSNQIKSKEIKYKRY